MICYTFTFIAGEHRVSYSAAGTNSQAALAVVLGCADLRGWEWESIEIHVGGDFCGGA